MDDLEYKRDVLISKLEKEIDDINRELDKKDLSKWQLFMLKSLKKFVLFIKFSFPYYMVGALTFSLFGMFNKAPFIRDVEKEFILTKKEIDSSHNISYSSTYYSKNIPKSIITHYNKWEKNGSQYKRNVFIYEISNENVLSNIDEIITSSYNFDDLGKSSCVTEIKDDISEEENKEYVQATIYNVDSNDYIIVKENATSNVFYTILFLIILFGLESKINSNMTDEINDYTNDIKKIDTECEGINKDELKKKLEIKISNYNKLKGE